MYLTVQEHTDGQVWYNVMIVQNDLFGSNAYIYSILKDEYRLSDSV